MKSGVIGMAASLTRKAAFPLSDDEGAISGLSVGIPDLSLTILIEDRLALSDISDTRIPKGGTPGLAVLDLMAGYRKENLLAVSLVFENLCDSPYRYHGSSVDGPGRGLSLIVDLGQLWQW